MRAMVLKSPDSPFVQESYPDPTPGPREVVARVFSCGSGLSLQHMRTGRIPVKYPRIVGHEITAEVVAIGNQVFELSVGAPVTTYMYLSCGRCRWCRINRESLCPNISGIIGETVDGGYAEYIKLPVNNFIKIPESLDHKNHPAEIGIICDSLATPWKTFKRARIAPGETVAIFGAGGGLGIHMLKLCHWMHVKTIAIDIAPEKLDVCREVGAHQVVDATQDNVFETIWEMSHGNGIEVSVDFISTTNSLVTACHILGLGGRLVTLGGAGELFYAHSKDLLNKELEIMGSRYATKQDVIEAIELVVRGDIWPMVTKTYRLEEAELVHDQLEKSGLVLSQLLIDE